MHKILILFFTIIMIFSLGGCEVFNRVKDEEGEVKFNLDLSYPKGMGYNITQVHVILEYQDTGIVIEDDLNIDAESERAYGNRQHWIWYQRRLGGVWAFRCRSRWRGHRLYAVGERLRRIRGRRKLCLRFRHQSDHEGLQ